MHLFPSPDIFSSCYELDTHSWTPQVIFLIKLYESICSDPFRILKSEDHHPVHAYLAQLLWKGETKEPPSPLISVSEFGPLLKNIENTILSTGRIAWLKQKFTLTHHKVYLLTN